MAKMLVTPSVQETLERIESGGCWKGWDTLFQRIQLVKSAVIERAACEIFHLCDGREPDFIDGANYIELVSSSDLTPGKKSERVKNFNRLCRLNPEVRSMSCFMQKISYSPPMSERLDDVVGKSGYTKYLHFIVVYSLECLGLGMKEIYSIKKTDYDPISGILLGKIKVGKTLHGMIMKLNQKNKTEYLVRGWKSSSGGKVPNRWRWKEYFEEKTGYPLFDDSHEKYFSRKSYYVELALNYKT